MIASVVVADQDDEAFAGVLKPAVADEIEEVPLVGPKCLAKMAPGLPLDPFQLDQFERLQVVGCSLQALFFGLCIC